VRFRPRSPEERRGARPPTTAGRRVLALFVGRAAQKKTSTPSCTIPRSNTAWSSAALNGRYRPTHDLGAVPYATMTDVFAAATS
jgi:hypothetical protein